MGALFAKKRADVLPGSRALVSLGCDDTESHSMDACTSPSFAPPQWPQVTRCSAPESGSGIIVCPLSDAGCIGKEMYRQPRSRLLGASALPHRGSGSRVSINLQSSIFMLQSRRSSPARSQPSPPQPTARTPPPPSSSTCSAPPSSAEPSPRRIGERDLHGTGETRRRFRFTLPVDGLVHGVF